MKYPAYKITVYNGGLGFLGHDKSSVDNYKNRLTPDYIKKMIKDKQHSTSIIDACIYSVDAVADIESPSRISGMYDVDDMTIHRLDTFAQNIVDDFPESYYQNTDIPMHSNFLLKNSVYKYCELISIIPDPLKSFAYSALYLPNQTVETLQTDITKKIKEIYNVTVDKDAWNTFVDYVNTQRKTTLQLFNCMTWAQHIFNAYDLDKNCYDPRTCPGFDYLALLAIELAKNKSTMYETAGGKSTRKTTRKSNKKNKRRSNRKK
jgi:hypothetical protein